ncbi:hypothetical protein GCM10027589_04680 [Actinocorallia lasiicapitis]
MSARRDEAGASASAMARQLRTGRGLGRRVAGYAAAFVVVALALTIASTSWRIGVGGGVLVLAVLVLVTGGRPARKSDSELWKQGAEGEAATAALLKPLARRGYVIMHDRALAGNSRANLDHLIVGPHGVLVADSKNWSKSRTARKRGGQVWIGRTHGSKTVQGLVYERDRVARILAVELGRDVAVPAALVVHGTKLTPWHRWEVSGIPMLQGGRKVRSWIRDLPAVYSPAEVELLVAACERRFPPYVDPAV